MRRALVIVALVASCHRSGGVDPSRLIAELGLDGAAEALRVKVADDPTDVGARRALAAVEDRRGRPGVVIEQLLAVRVLGAPLGSPLDGSERDRLAALLRERAAARAARGSPDGVADLDVARQLAGGRGEDPAVREAAIRAAALAELRHTDPHRRERGAAAYGGAVADPDGATLDARGAAGLALWRAGARRAAHELLEPWERDGGRDDAAADEIDAWLAARAWWSGPRGRPDLGTLSRAVAAGGSPCHFPEAPGDHGCRAAAVLGDVARERQLVAVARARGWRTADPEEAAAWVAITARAFVRGELRSWLDELDARVDLVGLGIPPSGDARLPRAVPTWARPSLLRAAGRSDEAALALARARRDPPDGPAAVVLALEAALGDDVVDPTARPPGADPAPDDLDDDAILAAAVWPGAPVDLATIARAYRRSPAAGERVATDLAGRDVDLAAVAPPIAELFLALDDPARARAILARAVESSPGDVALRAALFRAIAAGGDGEAARLELVTVAAASGEPARALVDGARGLAAAGLVVDALYPAKLALEHSPPGAQHEVLALLIDLAGQLGRDQQVETFRTALAADRAAPDTTTLRARAAAGDAAALATAQVADPLDAGLALRAAAVEPDAARAIALLDRAAAWNPRDVPLRIARLARGDDPAVRVELAALAATRDVVREARLAAAHAVTEY